MKLLIIAGPYEADRIRRAAVSAGFETVAIEPGESLSGWISATRPDLIVMAPQMVNHDPHVALAKVRATPRGRVPVFFVGDASDEERFKNLADGFFVRPIAPADLIAQARARVVPGADKSGPIARPPLVPAADALSAAAGSSGPKVLPALDLQPLRAEGDSGVGAGASATMAPSASGVAAAPLRRPAPPGRERPAPAELLRHLAASIDASLDAEMLDVARGLVGESTAVANGAAVETEPEGGVPAPVENGPIGSPDIAILMGRIHFEKLTGRLTFHHGAARKTIFFAAGAPILARSNLADDRMGEMLARQGRLSRAQRAQGAAILESTGRRIGGVLVELGALKAGELVPLVQRHFEEIIYSVFAWPEGGEAPGTEGEWMLAPTPLPVEDREDILLELTAPAVIMEGIRRKYTAPRLLRRLGGGAQVMQLLAAGAATSSTLDEMALSDEERTLVRRFDGVRTLDEIRAAAHVADEVPCGLAWALVALRLAVATRAADATVAAAAAVAGNGAPKREAEAAAPAPPPRDLALEKERARAIDRARVLGRHALVQEGDYFQLLGLAREATAHEVRRAHQALLRELSAPSLDPDVIAELAGELRAIRAVLDEGARVLGDARLRRRYQAHLPVASARRPE